MCAAGYTSISAAVVVTHQEARAGVACCDAHALHSTAFCRVTAAAPLSATVHASRRGMGQPGLPGSSPVHVLAERKESATRPRGRDATETEGDPPPVPPLRRAVKATRT